MKDKVFVSFLGAGGYIDCVYYKDNLENYKCTTKFIQKAAIELSLRESEFSQILIVLTEKSEKIHWSDEPGSLKNILFEEMKLKNIVKTIKIEDGHSEEQIWKMFNKIYKNIPENSEIVLDITHAFRYIPMLGLSLLNFTKFIKNVSIKNIYYGCVEKSGSIPELRKILVEKRLAPILELREFSDIQDWTSAIDVFLKYGNPEKLIQIISVIKDNLFRSQKKDIGLILSHLESSIRNIYNDLSNVRGIDIYEGNSFINTNQNISDLFEQKDLITKEYNFLLPFFSLIERISNKFKNFEQNSFYNLIRAAELCEEYGLNQQGITLLRESIICFVMEENDYDSNEIITNKALREEVSKLISILGKHNNIVDTLRSFKHDSEIKNFDEKRQEEICKKSKRFAVLFDKIGKKRNVINHAGFGDETKNFKIELKKHINELKEKLNIHDDSERQT